jgi:hypothetical protein
VKTTRPYIVHHKIATPVVCVFSEQDTHVAAHAEQHPQQLITTRPTFEPTNHLPVVCVSAS